MERNSSEDLATVAEKKVVKLFNQVQSRADPPPPDKFSVIARGAGGIEELASELPAEDNAVMWGLVQCIIGSRTFARVKYVLLNFSGAATPPLFLYCCS